MAQFMEMILDRTTSLQLGGGGDSSQKTMVFAALVPCADVSAWDCLRGCPGGIWMGCVGVCRQG